MSTKDTSNYMGLLAAAPAWRDVLNALCMANLLHAEGKKIKYHLVHGQAGHDKITEEIGIGWEPIPREDFEDLMLIYRSDARCWRLEGTKKWAAGEPANEMKGWAYIRFPERELRAAIERFTSKRATRAVECERWLRVEERANIRVRKILRPLAGKQFPGLTDREFNSAYKKVFGGKRGRPKKSAD